ncbi:DUF2975 domain-containing protein [Flavobacterium phycosphaerae]|uniref:DUF2975 domain-containing protein n=1 Tax=Flavobacterium phycosphaerae TaxID=2697515 RepID=UPI00138985C6|nr:DUF2975 domain-containing protein [Flavobacterium phycosphaerae]
MRKLQILKTIVDYVWVLSLICYPLAILFAGMIVIDKDTFDVPVTLIGDTVDLTQPMGKAVLVIDLINFGVLLVALYYFRKLLTDFSKRLIFEEQTILLLSKIGTYIIGGSALYLLADLLTKKMHNKVGIEIGFGPFLYLLALGLFFKVLSEVFTIAKNMKEENELTI